MERKKLLAAVIAVMMSMIAAASFSDVSEGASGNGHAVLFDAGNGITRWADIMVDQTQSSPTVDEVLGWTAGGAGIDYIYTPSGGIEIDGLALTKIGSDDAAVHTGSFTSEGTTGTAVISEWHVFKWDPAGKEWVPITNAVDAEPYDAAVDMAVGHYPAGIVPAETPDHRGSWTMVRGNAEQTGGQSYVPDSADGISVEWTDSRGGTSGVYATVLTAQGHIFAKFGHGAAAAAAEERGPVVRCYTLNGDMKWEFRYDGISSYETATPLIVGDHIYVPAALGHIYRISWKEVSGIVTPGTSGVKDIAVPVTDNSLGTGTGNGLDGMKYSTGPGSLVFDSGCIFFACSNGMIYCVDTELDLIWAAQMKGSSYFMSPTVFDGYVAAGALNGSLYIMNKADGRMIDTDTAYTEPFSQSISDIRGSVASPVVLRSDIGYRIIFSVSSGRGMDSLVGGIGMYDFDGTALTNKYLNTADFGLVSNYLQPVAGSVFDGVYFTSTKGLFRITASGEHELLNDSISRTKAPLTLVNGDRMFIVSYEPRKPVYLVGLDGTVLSVHTPQTTVVNYGMSPVVIAGGMVIYGNDSGLIVMSGTFPAYVHTETAAPPWYSSPAGALISILLSVILILAVMYAVMRLKGIRRPFAHIRGRISHYLGGEDLRHNTKNRHRLLVMIMAGAVITSVTFIACLCIGPTVKMSVGEMFSAMFSAIAKGGTGLSYNELMVYESRLPRTLMALLVGIGLSVAGCIYQAIIRNPLVDPYIMGVSAGAGTAAVSVIAFNFTLFGLFSPHSIYLTAVCAMIGGIAAFFATMLIAEKAGGTSVNYVLAGIVIGLALSSLQTLMLSMAGQHAVNALSWLFGSFANVSWNHIRLIVFPLIALSLVPLFWAREFNLVLLGEDQARQMGLNVRRFSRSMLILASVLTALCVAFVGIIGFVGLVIPHLCRMILGGDHRLVMPASIAVGGALMMFADLIARTAYFGHELPVGAITTMIGVPVFAYLLIKRGKLYEG